MCVAGISQALTTTLCSMLMEYRHTSLNRWVRPKNKSKQLFISNRESVWLMSEHVLKTRCNRPEFLCLGQEWSKYYNKNCEYFSWVHQCMKLLVVRWSPAHIILVMLFKMKLRQTEKSKYKERERKRKAAGTALSLLVSSDLMKRLPLKALPLFGLKTGLQKPLEFHHICRERCFIYCSKQLLWDYRKCAAVNSWHTDATFQTWKWVSL